MFLLLIFFMVTSSFQKTERELDPAIKVQKTSLSPSAQRSRAGDCRDRPQFRGDYVYKVGGREMTSAAELTDVLRQFDNKLDGAFVRAEDDAPFQMAADAIQASKNARFSMVFYVPLERRR